MDESGNPSGGIEVLSRADLYNEYIMTGLRTVEGVSAATLRNQFAEFEPDFIENARALISSGKIVFDGSIWKLTREGKLFADRIAADLFAVSE